MSDYVVVLAPRAEQDIADAFTWYRERNATVANAFRAEVLQTIDRLAETALSWPADEDGNRRRVVQRFPYTVWYEVLGSTITVLAVAHNRRRPEYWRK